MEKQRKILIPIDFTEASRNAVNYAKFIFRGEPANLILAYVKEDHSKSDGEIENEFKEFIKTVANNIAHFEFHIYNGDTVKQLTQTAEEHQADLVIMGLKDNFNADETSISQLLLKAFDCPVIAVPEKYKDHQLHHIAYANDFKEIKMSSVYKTLMDIALKFGARMSIFHINREKKPVLVDNSESTLEYFLEHVDHDYVAINDKDLVTAVESFTQEENADLLVTLSRDHGDNKMTSEGQLIYKLVETVKIPMFILC